MCGWILLCSTEGNEPWTQRSEWLTASLTLNIAPPKSPSMSSISSFIERGIGSYFERAHPSPPGAFLLTSTKASARFPVDTARVSIVCGMLERQSTNDALLNIFREFLSLICVQRSLRQPCTSLKPPHQLKHPISVSTDMPRSDKSPTVVILRPEAPLLQDPLHSSELPREIQPNDEGDEGDLQHLGPLFRRAIQSRVMKALFGGSVYQKS